MGAVNIWKEYAGAVITGALVSIAAMLLIATGLRYTRIGRALCFSVGGHRTRIESSNAATVADAFLSAWVCRFGAALSLHSDCGANFQSKLVRDVCDILRIHKTHTTPAHPEGNGQTERTNRTIINLLKALVESHDRRNWDLRLPYAMMTYRATLYSSTGYSPFFLLTGRHLRLPSDSLLLLHTSDGPSPDAYASELQETLRLAHNLARSHLRKAYERQKTYFGQHVHGAPHSPGDL
ncbi:unnamed protein product [Dibothriocephalus latus]|uniref:Integrase catalytic domain-containing protein n=1 Tax=Dibothriocephalus latus TaxID=60516 RepID=A0A3P7NN55_DIBLA|nr:unnamed protein product [Dibothriocephalus latus]